MDTLRYYRDLAGWHYRDRKRRLRFRFELRFMALLNWGERRWPSKSEDQ